jgi:hypothetical protein
LVVIEILYDPSDMFNERERGGERDKFSHIPLLFVA